MDCDSRGLLNNFQEMFTNLNHLEVKSMFLVLFLLSFCSIVCMLLICAFWGFVFCFVRNCIVLFVCTYTCMCFLLLLFLFISVIMSEHKNILQIRSRCLHCTCAKFAHYSNKPLSLTMIDFS